MFTGIVDEIGHIRQIKRSGHSCMLTISCRTVLEGTKLGDSIAVNGACLTVTRMDQDSFDADVTPETLRRTSFSICRPGSPVNLERALRLCDRLGGHIMLGHVDGQGKILSFRKLDNSIEVAITLDKALMRYIVEKGSVAIDGISLTVAAVDDTSFSVSTIPHTVSQTNLHQRRRGDPVNLETDIIGKYVEKLLRPEEPKQNTLTKETLLRCGF